MERKNTWFIILDTKRKLLPFWDFLDYFATKVLGITQENPNSIKINHDELKNIWVFDSQDNWNTFKKSLIYHRFIVSKNVLEILKKHGINP